MKKQLIFLLLLSLLNQTLSENTKHGCMPEGIKLSLGDNFDLSTQYDKQKMIDSPRHDYTITYFTTANCPQNYIEIYNSYFREQKHTLKPYNITKFFQAKDTSGFKGTETRTSDFEKYIYEFQFDATDLNLDGDFTYSYDCFYPSDSNPSQFLHRETFRFFHPDYSKLKEREFKFVWIADFDINVSNQTGLEGRRIGKENMEIMDKYIKRDRSKFVAIIGGGDYGYDLPDDSGKRGEEFQKAGEFSYAQIPFVTVAGNHEEWYKFDYYNSFFRNPRYSITKNDYYTLTFGEVLIVGLNTNKFIRDPTTNKFISFDQEYLKNLFQWFDDTMKQIKDNYRWIIVFSHQNIHCFEDYAASSCYSNPKIFAELEDLLVKHKVDIYMAGHVHAYERIHPNYRGEPKFKESDQCYLNKCSSYTKPSAPVYVVDGTGGTTHYFPQPSGYPGGNLTVASDRSLGFSTFTVKNKTHLLFQHFQSNNTYDPFDHFTIYKPQPNIAQDLSFADPSEVVKYKATVAFFYLMVAIVIVGCILIFYEFRRKILMDAHDDFMRQFDNDEEKSRNTL
ncbi:ser/thr phosphatase family protein (macronuclear) [Tetrahymena thermophila SB210]|uniref:Ser/thr phosphatase family protein n=1 Tax=Tetrahymena thermophila (strain SB210) TaxID=312017 RepID=I7MKP5_TETTS|nr:ser/thr phosphatase family protein [Tetrahymena thermophila SB210]EAR99677.2 ser/thr phosphatase family protein [Tetrahymena thermophila SB210]|eukprot:XP_001019922.2 ser/thr phosphatase family protein [Tetrahymena thermophila SB210]